MKMEWNSEMNETLRYLGFDKEWIDNFHGSIHFPVAEGEVTVANARLAPDFHVDLHFAGVGENPTYILERYTAHLLSYPPIKHKVVGDTDTRALEGLLASIDWTRDYQDLEKNYPELTEQDKEHLKQYVVAMYNLIMLAATDDGKATSDALRLRYLAGTRYEDRFITSELRQRFTRSFEVYVSGTHGLDFEQARNLLEGRPVLQRSRDDPDGFWLRLPPKLLNENGRSGHSLLVKGEERSPAFDLNAQLEILSLAVKGIDNTADIIKDLESGRPVTVISANGKKRLALTLHVEPELQKVIAQDEQGHKVHITTTAGFGQKSSSGVKQNKRKGL